MENQSSNSIDLEFLLTYRTGSWREFNKVESDKNLLNLENFYKVLGAKNEEIKANKVRKEESISSALPRPVWPP